MSGGRSGPHSGHSGRLTSAHARLHGPGGQSGMWAKWARGAARPMCATKGPSLEPSEHRRRHGTTPAGIRWLEGARLPTVLPALRERGLAWTRRGVSRPRLDSENLSKGSSDLNISGPNGNRPILPHLALGSTEVGKTEPKKTESRQTGMRRGGPRAVAGGGAVGARGRWGGVTAPASKVPGAPPPHGFSRFAGGHG